MSQKPPSDAKGYDAEFDRVLRHLVNTPHKPHINKQERDSPESKDKGGG